MTPEEAKKRLMEDPDFINIKRYLYSAQALHKRYPEGAPKRLIARAMMLSEEEVDQDMELVVKKLRELMKVEV